MKNRKHLTALFLLFIVFLSSCAASPNEEGMTGEETSDVSAEIQAEDEPYVDNGSSDLNAINAEIVAACSGTTIEKSFETAYGQIILNVTVNVDGINCVDSYAYILEPVSDDLRLALLKSCFPDRIDEIEYDELNDIWMLRNSEAVGDYYLFEVYVPSAGETIREEEGFLLENRAPDLYPFDDNLIENINDSTCSLTPDEVYSMCEEIIDDVGLGDYRLDYILAYGTNGRHPFYKVSYKMYKDNMPITGYNDLLFWVDDNGIQRIAGAVFSIGNSVLEQPILSLDAALDCFADSIAQIYLDSDAITVSKITLEYIVIKDLSDNPIIVPAWRFLIGETDEEINRNRNVLMAVNAINGDIIYEERGSTF